MKNIVNKKKNRLISYAFYIFIFLIPLVLISLLNELLPKTILKNYFQKRSEYCFEFKEDECPKDVCELGNIGGGPGLGFAVGCRPKMRLF